MYIYIYIESILIYIITLKEFNENIYPISIIYKYEYYHNKKIIFLEQKNELNQM